MGWIDGIRKSLGDEAHSAKRDDTQARRLAQLIADSAAGRRIGALTPQASTG